MPFDHAARGLLTADVPDLQNALMEYVEGTLSPKQFEMRVRRELQEWQRSIVGMLLQDVPRKKAYSSALTDVKHGLAPEVAAQKWQVDIDLLKKIVACRSQDFSVNPSNVVAGSAVHGR